MHYASTALLQLFGRGFVVQQKVVQLAVSCFATCCQRSSHQIALAESGLSSTNFDST